MIDIQYIVSNVTRQLPERWLEVRRHNIPNFSFQNNDINGRKISGVTVIHLTGLARLQELAIIQGFLSLLPRGSLYTLHYMYFIYLFVCIVLTFSLFMLKNHYCILVLRLYLFKWVTNT